MRITILIIAILASGSVSSTGIAFTQFGCANQLDASDISQSGVLIESRLTVINTNSDDTFDVQITGGIPRVGNNFEACIDSTLFGSGYEDDKPTLSDGNTVITPGSLSSSPAVAWYNGDDLVVLQSSVLRTSDPSNSDGVVSSSVMVPLSAVMIFNVDETTGSFRLTQILQSGGASIGNSSNVTTGPLIYIDDLSPTLFFHRNIQGIVYKVVE